MQKKVLRDLLNGQHSILLGSAGTGKTYLALYSALHRVYMHDYSSVVIVRSAVPVRDIGFLPGTLDDKTFIYEDPYIDICSKILKTGSYYKLKGDGIIRFITTSFIRGITLEDCVVLVDECQSFTAHELDSIVTRLGSNCKLILCGDSIQTDLKDSSGFNSVLRLLRTLPQIKTWTFADEDIVRSGLVKDYILARNRLGLTI